jgi:excisionase family DNA binding protein
MNQTDISPILMTVAAASIFSGISKSQLYRAIQGGCLKAHMVGSRWRILRNDLLAYIHSLPVVGA